MLGSKDNLGQERAARPVLAHWRASSSRFYAPATRHNARRLRSPVVTVTDYRGLCIVLHRLVYRYYSQFASISARHHCAERFPLFYDYYTPALTRAGTFASKLFELVYTATVSRYYARVAPPRTRSASSTE